MNRRTFLFAVGATACGASAAKPERPRRKKPVKPDEVIQEPVEEITLANVSRSPIALFHDRLVQETRDGELRFWDAATLTQLGSVALRSHGFCFLSYGALAVLVQPAGAKRCEVHLIDRHRAAGTGAPDRGRLGDRAGRDADGALPLR